MVDMSICKKVTSAVITALFLLSGCQKQTTPVSTDIVDTSADIETVASETAEAQSKEEFHLTAISHNSPYTAHDNPINPNAKEIDSASETDNTSDYESYFSTIIRKQEWPDVMPSPVGEDYINPPMLVINGTQYPGESQLTDELSADMVVLINSETEEIQAVLYNGLAEGVTTAPDYAIAVVENGNKLLALPYDGGESILLYEDPYGSICKYVEYYKGCVFFVAGVNEEELGIYRLFLPENTLDLLVAGLPKGEQEDGFSLNRLIVYSNTEVSFVISCNVIEKYGASLWDVPFIHDQDKGKITPRELFHPHGINRLDDLQRDKYLLSFYRDRLIYYLFENGICQEEHYYYNSATNALEMCYSLNTTDNLDFHFIVYPDGNTRKEDEQNKSHRIWWNDEFYRYSEQNS